MPRAGHPPEVVSLGRQARALAALQEMRDSLRQDMDAAYAGMAAHRRGRGHRDEAARSHSRDHFIAEYGSQGPCHVSALAAHLLY
jgi:hypothetical protein